MYLLIVFLLFSCNSEKIGYVDLNKLFEEFRYKKSLTKEYNKVKAVRKRVVDSLEFELNQMANAIEQKKNFNATIEMEFELKKKNYLQIGRQFEDDNQILLESYNSKIITQLNSYLKEYGRDNHFKILIGADNKGNVLYGDESIDETSKALGYINERFEGEKVNK